jgi:hypothetical protein
MGLAVTSYEHCLVTWPPGQQAEAIEQQLADLGRHGWQAVSMTTRSSSVPAPGRGGTSEAEVVILLVRPSTENGAAP